MEKTSIEVEVQASLTENGWQTSVLTYIHGNPFDLKPLGVKQAYPGGQLYNNTEKRKALLILI
jgi:hypothetical protein